jgi:hypothetical protein
MRESRAAVQYFGESTVAKPDPGVPNLKQP